MSQLNPGYIKEVDKLVRKYTGWGSLKQMCMNTPTLRVTKTMKPAERDAIREMRKAYAMVNGKEAFPATGWDETKRR